MFHRSAANFCIMASCTIAVAIHESQLPVSNSVVETRGRGQGVKLQGQGQGLMSKDKDLKTGPRVSSRTRTFLEKTTLVSNSGSR